MSDPITTSKSARENLSRGLNALQADTSVPPELVELAAPIAQAMGALHQLERNNQLAPHAEVALGHVRGALQQLQTHPSIGHPAVQAALEAVAASLGLVNQLSRMAAAGGPAPAVQAAPVQPAPAPVQAAPAPVPVQAMPAPMYAAPAPVQAMPAPMEAAPVAAPTVKTTQPLMPPLQAMAPPQAMPPMQPMQAPVFHQAPPAQHQAPIIAVDPFAQRDPFAGGNAGVQVQATPATPSMPVPAPPAVGNMHLVNAELGAHSVTNFYKGLSGNDIVDHGGLFVSTYVSPKIGTPVRLKVSLPGGYEFEANATVKWVREQGADAPPGFGASFTAITPEARQLVYRYVRNREPLFYDDL